MNENIHRCLAILKKEGHIMSSLFDPTLIEMKKTNIKATFSISNYDDDFDPNIITSRLKIQPTDLFVKGSLRPQIQPGQYRGIYNRNAWILKTERKESIEIKNQLLELVNVLKAKKEILIELKNTFELEIDFGIVIYILDGNTPASYLPKEIIRFMADLDAGIDFDIYVWED